MAMQDGNDPKFLIAEKVLVALQSHHMNEEAKYEMDYGANSNIAEIPGGFEIAVRFWGEWTEDDPHNVYEMPTQNTQNEISHICYNLMCQYPQYKICWAEEEKFWLYITIE